nr:Chain P, PEPTIDE [Saccharomyces cerevisiae]
YANATSA